jgi:hypothetical protein
MNILYHRVGIHRANLADWIYEIAIHSRIFILDFPTNTVRSCEIYIISFLTGNWAEKNAGMPENCLIYDGH